MMGPVRASARYLYGAGGPPLCHPLKSGGMTLGPKCSSSPACARECSGSPAMPYEVRRSMRTVRAGTRKGGHAEGMRRVVRTSWTPYARAWLGFC